MEKRRVPSWLTFALATLAALLLTLAVLNGELIYVLGVIFSSIAAYSSRQNAPHTYLAARALEEGTAVERVVTIKVETWSDSESYSVKLVQANLTAWTFDFVPLGWTPKPGSWKATVFQLPDVAWPVLVRFDDGIAYPRAQPTQVRG
jgi:hypothetical protein